MSTMRRVVTRVVCALAIVLMGEQVAAQDILIRNARVHTMTSAGTLDGADVLVRAGKIVAVGSNLAASNATVIDAAHRPLTPGLFAGVGSLGVVEVAAVPDTSDESFRLRMPVWEQQWRPEFDVTLAYNPASSLIPVNRIEGMTWGVLAPYRGDSIVAGQGGAVTYDGRYDALIPGSRSLFVQWHDGDSVGGTRAGLFMLMQQAIREVRSPPAAADRALMLPAGREAFAGYLNGGRIVFNVDRAVDIRRLIDFTRRNGLKPVISGGAEAWRVADELARANIPVLLNPLDNLPDNFDMMGARLDNATLLHRAGVRVAFSSGHVHNARKNRQVAGNTVAHGLPWEVALAAITATPAEIFGVGATRGHIAVGQAADLVLWSGDPLELSSLAEQVWIGGAAIEMRSRQSDLRDRYFQRLKSARP
ncbi:amidohydrolase family protein [Peristeroidobacter soli]|jgi:hypothetical protein|uniref:amidohydrolase family protein n=1 Tax=Peristeroidobacter soli TaxID=2497877 RepID=UPI00101C94F2|nr:amidohydrolase family protein [Peristeroidobacter soli]